MPTASGRLLFSEKVNGQDKPMHNMPVALYDDDVGPDDLLAFGFTELDGRFTLKYDKKDAGLLDVPDLMLNVYSLEVHYRKDGTQKSRPIVLRGYKPEVYDDVDQDSFSFGDIRVAFYEYSPEAVTPTPRLLLDDDHPCQQKYKPGRQKEFVEQTAKTALYLAGVPWPPTMIEKLEVDKPGWVHSDEFFTDIALNGFNPCLFKKSPDGKSLYSEYLWNGYSQDGTHFAPNTVAFFDAQSLVPTSMQVQKRTGQFIASYNAVMEQPKVYKPSLSGNDLELWTRVKTVWRSNYFLFGETLTHLAGCHLNLEQYIVPVCRNLQKSPLRVLLTPHFNGTVMIDKDADTKLLGPTGAITVESAATNTSLAQMAHEGFAAFNWFGFKPRTALNTNHRFALLGNLFWGVLVKYVDYFFKENAAQIAEHWAEVKRLSDELLAHSVPYRDQKDSEYYCTNEVNRADYEHPEVNGRKTALSPVTKSDKVNDKDLENAKQLCRYIIYWSTFVHSWVNDSQYDFAGDADYVSIGLSADITDLHNSMDDAISASGRKAMRSITYLLSSVKYGYIMRDEDSDIHPKFKEFLGEQREAFKQLGMDIDNIRSKINI